MFFRFAEWLVILLAQTGGGGGGGRVRFNPT